MGRDYELAPQDFREITAYLKAHRSNEAPFDVIAAGHTTGTDKEKDVATVRPFAEAGVTWWQECFDGSNSLEQVRTRIHLGPPEA